MNMRAEQGNPDAGDDCKNHTAQDEMVGESAYN
jgi:hypothetical protein